MAQNMQHNWEEIGEVMTQLTVTTTDLGEGNHGSIGPDNLDAETRAAITDANRDPQYEKRPTNRWICVDGRCSANEVAHAGDETDIADPQIGGGLAVSETAAEFMVNPAPQPLLQTITAKTREAVADKLEVVIHGADDNREGCAANKDLRQTLRYNAAHADVVVDKSAAVLGLLGLGEAVSRQDLTELVSQGADAAEDDNLWNGAAADVVDAVVAAGGTYQALQGLHGEGDIRAMVNNTAFAKGRFVQNMSTPERTVQQFAASFGAYKVLTFDRAAAGGRSEHEAALQVAAVVLFNIGLCKHLSTREMPVDIIS